MQGQVERDDSLCHRQGTAEASRQTSVCVCGGVQTQGNAVSRHPCIAPAMGSEPSTAEVSSLRGIALSRRMAHALRALKVGGGFRRGWEMKSYQSTGCGAR
eukprot:2785554-Pleurochrysis_carterae.AAC.1